MTPVHFVKQTTSNASSPKTPVRFEGGVLYSTPSSPPKELDGAQISLFVGISRQGTALPFLGLHSTHSGIVRMAHPPTPTPQTSCTYCKSFSCQTTYVQPVRSIKALQRG